MLQSPMQRQLLVKLAQRGVGQRRTLPPTASPLQLQQQPLSSSPSSFSRSIGTFASSRLSPLARPLPAILRTTPLLPIHHVRGYNYSPMPQYPAPPPRQNGARVYRHRSSLISRFIWGFIKFDICVCLGVFIAIVLNASVDSRVRRSRTRTPPKSAKEIEDDEKQLAEIRNKVEAHPDVQALLASEDWVAARHHEAYASFDESSRPNRLTTGPLGGPGGIGGHQHVYHNSKTGEVLTVVYIGQGVAGFPRLTHGGLLATLLDEQCARAAMDDAAFAGQGADKRGIVTARLDVNYTHMAPTKSIYVVRARAFAEEDLPEKDRGKRDRKCWVKALVETIDGQPCVEATALYVKPAGTILRAVGENF